MNVQCFLKVFRFVIVFPCLLFLSSQITWASPTVATITYAEGQVDITPPERGVLSNGDERLVDLFPGDSVETKDNGLAVIRYSSVTGCEGHREVAVIMGRNSKHIVQETMQVPDCAKITTEEEASRALDNVFACNGCEEKVTLVYMTPFTTNAEPFIVPNISNLLKERRRIPPEVTLGILKPIPLLKFKLSPHFVSGIVLTPSSPATLKNGQHVNITFNYTTNEKSGVRIWARPFVKGSLAPNYAAHGSPTYPFGQGSGSGSFTITSGEVTVDHIRFQIIAANQNTLLHEYFLPVEYRFTEKSTLSPPVQIAPAHGTVFDHYPRKTTFVWKPVQGATSYTVEIDCYHCCQSGKWCSDVAKPWIIVPNLTNTEYTFNFVGAQPGRWRVWTVGPDGQESPKTDWWEFRYTR
jgi:hypothetical protein